MNNILGLNEFDLEIIEEKIYDFKSKLIDEKFTFNEKEFNLNYLIKLHEFLFGDLYFDNGISKRIKEEDIINISSKINEIVDLIKYDNENDDVNKSVNDLKDMQIFDDGNNRTIDLFVDIVCKSFNYELNKEIRIY